MKKRLECQRRPQGAGWSQPAGGNRAGAMEQPEMWRQPMGQQPMGPAMPGHMQMPMPSGMPYPWMQRPMPGQWMPGMEMNNNDMANMGAMPPAMMDSGMGMWTMPQWNAQMWNPDMEEDPAEMRDMEYWQQLYPEQTRRIQREVEHQCDLLDYEGSVMYDEYPDRISLARICEAVYNALMQSGIVGGPFDGMSSSMSGGMNSEMNRNRSQEFVEDDGITGDVTLEEEQAGARGYQPIGQVDMMQTGRRNRSLQDLIEVLLYHEMHRRRRRRRRHRSWYFG